MKYKFREVRLSKPNKVRLDQINSIIREYQRQNYKLTLRQLYYQLVSRDIIPNQQKEYSKLSILLKEGRMGGIVDWDAIEDRLRSPESPGSWDNPGEILESAIKQYAKPRMRGQDYYVEVWVEKDALSGVLSRVTRKYHIPILVNRGYSSASAMYDSFNRFNDAFENSQKIRILYLGDYDPSGIDMIRDVKHRIQEFFLGRYNNPEDLADEKINAEWMEQNATHSLEDNPGLDFDIIPIALTREQINQYDPPPNPAKLSDPRSGKFVQAHGSTSWEVDALRPEVLNQILTDAIEDIIDIDMYEEVVSEEKADKDKLKKLKDQFFNDDTDTKEEEV